MKESAAADNTGQR